MKLNLYDFDGTIYDGDSGVDLVLFAIKKNPRVLLTVLSSLWVGLLCLLKIKSKEDFKNKVFSFLKDIDDVPAFVSEFWESHECKIKDFWKDKKSHKKDVIISASGYFWLKPVADKYKVYDLFATDINPKTGKVKGNNCHGKEKVKLFYDRYPDAKILKMYTDSINDLPLIEEADEGILVKKNKLYEYYSYKPNLFVRFWRWGWGIYHKNEELWNYLIVGFLTTVVSFASHAIITHTLLDPKDKFELQLAVVFSWICAVGFAYVTNRIFVFKSKSKDYFREISTFVGARVFSLFLEMLVMYIFVTLLSQNDIVGKLIAQVIVTVTNYILSKLFVFKKEK